MKAKDKLITAAGNLFLVKGYNGTSADQIITEAKVAKGSFFYNFKNKSALAKAVVRHFYDFQIKQSLLHAFDSHKAPEKKIYAFLKAVNFDLNRIQFVGGCLLANFSLELSDTDNEIKDEMNEIYKDWRSIMYPVVKETMNENKKEVDDVVEFIITALQGITLTSKVHKNKARVNRDFAFLKKQLEKRFRRPP